MLWIWPNDFLLEWEKMCEFTLSRNRFFLYTPPTPYILKTVYDTDDRRIHQYCYIICVIFDTNMDKIESNDKTNDLPLARQLLTYYLTKINVPRTLIITLLNYSDPSIVIYNLKKINELIDTGDHKIKTLLTAINYQIALNPTTNG